MEWSEMYKRANEKEEDNKSCFSANQEKKSVKRESLPENSNKTKQDAIN
jgi:hypothetical protein